MDGITEIAVLESYQRSHVGGHCTDLDDYLEQVQKVRDFLTSQKEPQRAEPKEDWKVCSLNGD